MTKLIIRNRTSISTSVSSFFLTHEYNVDLIDSSLIENLRQSTLSTHFSIEKTENILFKLKTVAKFAQTFMTVAQQLQKEYANRFRDSSMSYEVENKV